MKRFIASALVALFAPGTASAQVASVSLSSSPVAAHVASDADLGPNAPASSIQRFNARIADANAARDCGELRRAFGVRTTMSPSRRHSLLTSCRDVAERAKLRVASEEQ